MYDLNNLELEGLLANKEVNTCDSFVNVRVKKFRFTFIHSHIEFVLTGSLSIHCMENCRFPIFSNVEFPTKLL